MINRVKQNNETTQSEKTLTKVPSIQIDNINTGAPNENQIVDSEKYKNLLNERDNLIEQKEKTDTEKKKLNNELDLLRKLVSQRNVDKEAEWEIIGEKVKEITAERDLLEREKVNILIYKKLKYNVGWKFFKVCNRTIEIRSCLATT